jgi:hypothetical protein
MRRLTRPQGCCTTPSAMCFWAAAFVLFYGAGLLLGAVWPAVRHYQDTVLLVALAAACFVNFHRNRTLHCVITGPLFLVGAIVVMLAETGILRVDLSALWGVVLLGVGLAFVIEWRTVGRNSHA